MLRRRLMQSSIPKDAVDLGLPSGLLWCTHNIGGTNPEDYGYYFSWGNVEGHVKGSGYNFEGPNYVSTPGYSLTGDIPANDTYDIARKVMGSPWRLPTKDEFKELYDNTDSEWVVYINGEWETNPYYYSELQGRKFMKKSDHSVYVIIPACGYYNGTTLKSETTCHYRSSTHYDNLSAYYLQSGYNHYYPEQRYLYRYYGLTGRAVMSNEQKKGLQMKGLQLSFEEYNTTAASGYTYIEVYLDGVRINPNNTTYTSDGFSSIGKDSTRFTLNWNGNQDEHNKKIMSITITYSGENKTAYVIQDEDAVISTFLREYVLRITGVTKSSKTGYRDTRTSYNGFTSYTYKCPSGNYRPSWSVSFEKRIDSYDKYSSGKEVLTSSLNVLDSTHYYECNLRVDQYTDGTVKISQGSINLADNQTSTWDENIIRLNLEGGNGSYTGSDTNLNTIIYSVDVSYGNSSIGTADVRIYSDNSFEITLYP